MTNYFFNSIKIIQKINNGFNLSCSFKNNNSIKHVTFNYLKDDNPKNVINEMKEYTNININNENELINIIKIFNNLNTRIISISNC